MGTKEFLGGGCLSDVHQKRSLLSNRCLHKTVFRNNLCSVQKPRAKRTHFQIHHLGEISKQGGTHSNITAILIDHS